VWHFTLTHVLEVTHYGVCLLLGGHEWVAVIGLTVITKLYRLLLLKITRHRRIRSIITYYLNLFYLLRSCLTIIICYYRHVSIPYNWRGLKTSALWSIKVLLLNQTDSKLSCKIIVPFKIMDYRLCVMSYFDLIYNLLFQKIYNFIVWGFLVKSHGQYKFGYFP